MTPALPSCFIQSPDGVSDSAANLVRSAMVCKVESFYVVGGQVHAG